MPTRDLEQLAHAWSFLACLHPPPPQYASSSAWRLRVLEVLLEHPATAHDTRQGVEPGVGQRVPGARKSGGNATGRSGSHTK